MKEELNITCICGKHFNSRDELWHHKANCKEFQANQNKGAINNAQ